MGSKEKGKEKVSEETHPNLHAVGLAVDILLAVQHRVRGDAATVNVARRTSVCIASEVLRAVTRIEEIIDIHTAELKKGQTS